MTDVFLQLSDPRDTLKMLRETLSAVQNGATGARRGEHSKRIGRIIAEIDRQRPLGTNGKHGNLHTETCGCDNQSITEIIERSSLGTPDAQALRATVSDEKAHALVAEAHRRSEPQGEPSDAQVVAALNAFMPDSATPRIETWEPHGFAARMRAALRAAGGAA